MTKRFVCKKKNLSSVIHRVSFSRISKDLVGRLTYLCPSYCQLNLILGQETRCVNSEETTFMTDFRLSTSKWSAWQTSRIEKVFWQISFNLSKITASKHLPLLCFSTRTSNLEDSCHSMFFQLKLQTFLIKVGFHKAEIHKMARWHLVYHLLGSGGKKNKNDPWVLAEMRSLGIIYFDALATSNL